MNQSWIELRCEATAEGVDWVRSLLATIGYIGSIDIRPIEEPIDPWQFGVRIYRVRHSAPDYFFETDRIVDLLEPLQRTGLTSAPESTVVTNSPSLPAAPTARIGRFVVQPPGSIDRSSPEEISLQLGETLSFGSGLHPTTGLSLQLLDRHLKPQMQALDLGSGSGILSVAMAKLGAQVVAIDNDPIAVEATKSAVELNGLKSQVRACVGSLGQGGELGHWLDRDLPSGGGAIEPTAEFDLIVANIFARVQIALASDYRRAVKPEGIVITAGYTIDFSTEVEAALCEVGFETVDREAQNEWVAIVHRVC